VSTTLSVHQPGVPGWARRGWRPGHSCPYPRCGHGRRPCRPIGEQNEAGHPPVPRQLFHIRRDQRIGDRHRVRNIVVPAVHQRVERRAEDLLRRDPVNLAPRTSHAVAPVMPCTPDRRQRAAGRYRLDLQKNSRCAMAPPAEELPRFRMLRSFASHVNG